MDKSTKKGIFFAIFGAICWGFSGTLGQYLFQSRNLSPEWTACVRMLAASIIFIILSFHSHGKDALKIFENKKNIYTLFSFGLAGLLLCQYSYLKAIAYTNSGTATVLNYLGPTLIMLFVCVNKKRFPLKREITAIILALVGIYVIATNGNIHTLVISKAGLMWGLISAVGMLFYTILPEKMTEKYGSTATAGFSALIGGIFACIIFQIWKLPPVTDLTTIFLVFLMVIFGTVCAFGLYLKGITLIGPVKTSMIASVEPIAATLFSACMLQTHFSFIEIIGFILIIISVIFAAQTKNN
jgi:drug/metabolite transporter (DMT)-like permease